ncbi:MAG TPA: SDR family oxidoreductase [Sediminispirochaeta sp.]|nr:SDR family oxidoreductase [Sediminispirochaeta sp.]
MKVLFIGGTGVISSACVREAARRGIEVFVYNRGSREAELPEGVVQLKGDIRDPQVSRRVLGGFRFDAVLQWVGFKPEDVERDIELFSGKTEQYVFISSASAYAKPPAGLYVTEGTLLKNPYWQYSRDKIACEERLIAQWRQRDFPITIVRPSHTYGDRMIPSIFDRGPTIVDRIRRGKPVVVPGDGTSRWTVTHNSDFARGFVGLLGNPAAIGEAFHLTSDEALTWDQIHRVIAAKLGTEADIQHIPADFICARYPEFTGPLKGDKIHTALFDNGKIKRLVPGFVCRVPFHRGIEGALKRIEKHPEENEVSLELDQKLDQLVRAYRAI